MRAAAALTHHLCRGAGRQRLLTVGMPEGQPLPQPDIAQRFAQAEAAFHGFRFAEALDAYADCLRMRLAARDANGAVRFGQGDAVVIERLAELSTLFGWFEAADTLLGGLEGLFEAAGNVPAGLHIVIKRIDLATREALTRLERWTGPLQALELTQHGLERWEARLPLPRQDNFVLPGRRVVSLPETLMRAGAESVVGSLWPLADEVAFALMVRFYELMLAGGRAQALRQVQLEMIAGALEGCAIADQASPRHWAGITLFGDGGQLRL